MKRRYRSSEHHRAYAKRRRDVLKAMGLWPVHQRTEARRVDAWFAVPSMPQREARSAGCVRLRKGMDVKHGMHKTAEYKAWANAKYRCRNPNAPAWEHYGGRGITFSASWEEFEEFARDMRMG